MTIRHAALPCVVLLALAQAAAPAFAQNSANTFSLPQPSPTPTPAPQGPEDESAGVRIAPRIISPDEVAPAVQPTPRTQASPASTPTPVPTSTPRSTPVPRPARTSAPQPDAPRANGASNADRATSPAVGQTSSESSASDTVPGFESLPIPQEPRRDVGSDGFYDVTADDERRAANILPDSSTEDSTSLSTSAQIAAQKIAGLHSSILLAIAVLILLGAGIIWLFWRRRKETMLQIEGPAHDLIAGVSRVIAEKAPPTEFDTAKTGRSAAPSRPVSPAMHSSVGQPHNPQPPRSAGTKNGTGYCAVKPARLDFSAEISGASRSVMMFMVDFRIDIANRSDSAVRDLTVDARLICAQQGGGNAETVLGAQPAALIERIGPQQSHRVSGSLQLPLSEIRAIKQGSKPLFIPLLHVNIGGTGQSTTSLTFVIGSPSAAGNGRLHPLPFDGPPGALNGLRAQRIKQPFEEAGVPSPSPASA